MNTFRKMVLYSTLALPIGIPFFNSGFRELGSIGWYIIFGIMLIRPLADILPDLKFLRRLVPARKEFGILSATLILAHSYGYFLSEKLSVLTELQKASYWAYNSHFLWGIFGLVIGVILLITSNMKAVRILKTWWKPVQRFAYLFFLFGGIHIMFVNTSEAWEIMLQLVAVSSLWLLAHFNIKINFFKKNNINPNL